MKSFILSSGAVEKSLEGGQIVSDNSFGVTYSFIRPELCRYHSGYALVENNYGSFNFVDRNGRLMSKQWFECANDFFSGHAVVMRGGKRNIIRDDFTFVLNDWFDGMILDSSGDYTVAFDRQGMHRISLNDGKIY